MNRLHSEATPAAIGSPAETSAPTTRGPWAGGVGDERKRTAAGDRDTDRPHLIGPARPAAATGDPASADLGDDRLLDPTLLLDYAGFVVHAVRRHVIGAAATMALAFSAIALVAMLWPKSYEIDGRLLVHQSDIVSSLVNPDRALARDGNTPTYGAHEIVRSREHLLAVMRETNLMAEWDRTRPAVLRLKDRMIGLLQGAQTDDRRVDAMVGLLEDQLQVGRGEDGTISFVLHWRDPQTGQAIVNQAIQTFLNYRRTTETSAITDSIAILDRSADALEAQVNATVARLPGPSRRGAVRSVPRSAVPGPSPEATVRLARLRSALEARQQEIARLDGARAQQLAEAQAKLSTARTIYTSGHPTVLALQQTVAQLSGESADLTTARREARALEGEYDALSAKVGAETESAEQARALWQLPATSMPDLSRADSEAADPVGLRLRNQMAELAAVRARASAARAELASSQVGFKYQYTIVRPPQVPREPVAPNVLAILAAGALASVLLALAFAVTSDLASGRVLQTWQIERILGAPISIRIPRL